MIQYVQYNPNRLALITASNTRDIVLKTITQFLPFIEEISV